MKILLDLLLVITGSTLALAIGRLLRGQFLDADIFLLVAAFCFGIWVFATNKMAEGPGSKKPSDENDLTRRD